jgi:ubiquinone/menaquinone biosynthesis C-methylase UbiE
MSSQPSNFHASDGAAYEVWLGRWSRRLASVFLDFAEFPESGELLDVGCGTGALTFAMADRWPTRSVIGIDLAAPFISYAQSRRSGDRPMFETGDACALKYEDGRFAGVAAHLVFLFIPKPEVALREMRRVTRMYGPTVRRKRFSPIWRMCGLASMYPACDWSVLCSWPSWISARQRSH